MRHYIFSWRHGLFKPGGAVNRAVAQAASRREEKILYVLASLPELSYYAMYGEVSAAQYMRPEDVLDALSRLYRATGMVMEIVLTTYTGEVDQEFCRSAAHTMGKLIGSRMNAIVDKSLATASPNAAPPSIDGINQFFRWHSTWRPEDVIVIGDDRDIRRAAKAARVGYVETPTLLDYVASGRKLE